ncbi:MAG: NUDIX hydrolase [Burkholderiaceae bacterium]
MTPTSQIPPVVVPRPAASVLLLRDGEAGPEVYMLRRHQDSAAFAGAYVFPGGKLDQADCERECLGRVGAEPTALHAWLREAEIAPDTAAGLFYAACRETFEEARVLLARGADAALGERAWAMLREGFGFAQVLAAHDLQLAADDLVPWSRWITPRIPSMMARNKRFDTRFFVTTLPEGQEAGFDDHEAVAGDWLDPREALRRYRDGRIVLGPPQIMSLVQLAQYASTEAIIAAAREAGPPLIEPEPFEIDGCRVVAYPGDERHPVPERCMVGPTRLIQRNNRFEPIEGIDALMACVGC